MEMLKLDRQLEVVYVYASMKNDEDTANAKYQALMARVQKLLADVSAKLAWFQPELLALAPEKLASYYQAEPRLNTYKTLVNDWTRLRAHVLSEKEEALLAGASDILGASANVFEVFKQC